MAQTKIIVDSNSYFRLAQNIHPLLATPFGKESYTLYIHSDLTEEFKYSPRLKNKFDWVIGEKYAKNRSHSIGLSKEQKKQIEDAYSFMRQFVQEEFLAKKGKGPSPIDTRIVATAFILGIEVVTDDADMIELINEYGVGHLTSLGLMKRMIDCGHINDAKVDQVVEQWMYENDTPHKDWKMEFKSLFRRKPPNPSF